MAAAPPPMTPEKAKLILKETITLFSQPENQQRLTDALAEVAQLPPEQQPMGKMAKLMPIVTELAGGKLQEYGLPNVMMGVMQIQAVGQQDPVVMEGVQLLTAATMTLVVAGDSGGGGGRNCDRALLWRSPPARSYTAPQSTVYCVQSFRARPGCRPYTSSITMA